MTAPVANLRTALLPVLNLLGASITGFNPFPFNPGFNIENVTSLAVSLPSHSWEYGVTTQALLELYEPQHSVFGDRPFPVPVLPRNASRSLTYVADKIRWGDQRFDALDAGNGAAGDPASMGVAAVMLGKTEERFAEAAHRTAAGLLEDVPRFANGAISHRAALPVLWADFMYMVPPFLAYYAADNNNEDLLRETVRQCRLYREVLQANSSEPWSGLWRHIIGPEAEDPRLWATGNAWTAAGMARVLATVMKAPVSQGKAWRQGSIDQLTTYIKEILDGAINAPHDDGLIRNYMDDQSSPNGFGEISGSSLLAGTAYRMAVIDPQTFGRRYIEWADGIRATLSGRDRNGNPHVTETGVVTPAVNPLGWRDPNPLTTGSPEGQAFVVLMYTAWRDCVKAGICSRHPEGSGASVSSNQGRTGPVGSRRMVKRSHHALQRRAVDHHHSN
ncbi:hypothetical protein CC1G_05212 [Coprinopsis cinerea okayama7|uniref:Glycosyl hydrolase n=1 Tax=Coprinopsis cinerea (strain Okayama-7 / 130 / ATCC MYA-4618 / FGSC 9003) TaxID=240176 RepID=A8PC65_COPC7|nr:hypothetical protein CC1G_05212 [Coprinopsis cinerea okayama7\|eukprot:XP_001840326.1 hypothetical protein CC1G_05212 [Coprinopsis cinerea okayama7\